ncbi:hypothetical protein BKA64DRAFT_68764 [Cadophora sp. MPI-SDFR-AT-0126]|nr:hypothetical protein BKA64DRAFT_68764 [Leotiomycetes sp. MPI-SDFR-AT-0126]
MRPAHGSLLLNVNTTMSAFFAPINLQEWICGRWPDKMIPPVHEAKELVGVRVTFQGDLFLDDAHTKQRKGVIHSFSSNDVAGTSFEDQKNQKKQKVLTHMKSTYKALYNHRSETSKWNNNTACVNLGGQVEKWNPANKLMIVSWQVVKRQLQPTYQDKMVKMAQKGFRG